MSKPLDGKVALVSGATRGGGRGIGVALGRQAPRCTRRVAARVSDARRSTAPSDRGDRGTVTAAGGTGIAVAVDHLDPAQVAALIARIDEEPAD